MMGKSRGAGLVRAAGLVLVLLAALAAAYTLFAGQVHLGKRTSAGPQTAGGYAAHPRPRPEIPKDWPPGKRIVMHITPSLEQSYIGACDMPVPAWNYLHRGHKVTIAADADAVTMFRRDSSGKTPLDKLEVLDVDLDDLSNLLEVPLPATPRNYGDLFRFIAAKGARIIANEEALRAHGIKPSEMDPVVKVVGGVEFQQVLSDLDALVPFDEIGVPHHSIFHHGHGEGH